MIRQLLVAMTVAIAAIGTTPQACADPMTDLIASLPPGYAPDSCHGTSKPVPRMLAGLECFPVPGVVPGGKYEVFANTDLLNDQFNTDFGGNLFKPLICPGAPSIGPGTVTARTGWTGQLACGWMGKYTDPAVGPVGEDVFAVMWTNESRSFWGRVNGTNLIGLWDWFGGVVIAS